MKLTRKQLRSLINEVISEGLEEQPLVANWEQKQDIIEDLWEVLKTHMGEDVDFNKEMEILLQISKNKPGMTRTDSAYQSHRDWTTQRHRGPEPEHDLPDAPGQEWTGIGARRG
jgi:hypothetical protein